MLKCSKNLKIALLLVGIYAVFLTALLTGISSAKYQETRVAYSNFGAASFNAVILSKTETGSLKVFDVFAEPEELSRVSGYRPGMEAKEIPFTVANGVTGENASDASVEYEIILRTTGHLPLEYTLRYNGENYQAGEKERIEPESEIGTVWYEQKFYKMTDGPAATFDLEGGKLNTNDYSLVVDWPVKTVDGVKTNDVRYMKEVDLLELFVTVSSKNMLEEDGYGSNSPETKPGNGIVILDPEKGENFVHTVDYRAFVTEEGTTSYHFAIENGVGKNVRHQLTNTSYTFKIEVPYTTDTQNFSYALKDAEGNAITLKDGGYRLYDVLYSHKRYNGNGGYTREFEVPAQADIETWSAPESQYKLYKVYEFSDPTVLNNAAHDEREYQLVLTGGGSAAISDEDAFDHKIEILVDAKETGNPLPVEQPEEGGDAGA